MTIFSLSKWENTTILWYLKPKNFWSEHNLDKVLCLKIDMWTDKIQNVKPVKRVQHLFLIFHALEYFVIFWLVFIIQSWVKNKQFNINQLHFESYHSQKPLTRQKLHYILRNSANLIRKLVRSQVVLIKKHLPKYNISKC